MRVQLLLVLLILPPICVAQTKVVWEKTYGGSATDMAFSIVGSGDGGFLVAGKTDSFGAGGGDVYLLKIDGDGKKAWGRTYGGSGSDEARCIVQSGDGGFLVAGKTDSFGAGGEDIYLVKIDGSGNVVWERTYGGTKDDRATCIVRSRDGGFVVAGGTNHVGAGSAHVHLLKIDEGGNKTWDKTYCNDGGCEAYGIAESGDGGFIVAGLTGSPGAERDVYLLKVDDEGEVVWQKTYGGAGSDEARCVTQDGEGGFVVAGSTYSSGFGYADTLEDLYLLRIDGNGNLLWEKVYGGANMDWASSIIESGDGGFIAAGVTESPSAKQDVYLLKIDGEGEMVWEKTYGRDKDEQALSVVGSGDGSFVAVGWTSSLGAGNEDVYLVKIVAKPPKAPIPTFFLVLIFAAAAALISGYIFLESLSSSESSTD